MAFRRKMYDTVDVILVKDPVDRLRVADVRFYKCIILTIFDVFQILKISGISQLVHIDDADLVVIFPEHVMNVV